ncbi:MAG: DEAD/DEAH box helicase [Kangiella sp.]|nr:DEAD/DEAH box helicase [Kangiella sp.]
MSDTSIFQELHSGLQKALQKLKFEVPSEVQEKAIEPILDGHDVMVSAETGSGKTAAFLLPIIHNLLEKPSRHTSTRVLILAPTRELARQIDKHARDLTQFTQVKTGLIIGGADYKYQQAIFRDNPEIIIATPGRMLEHCEKQGADLNDLEYLVIDEADKMFEMGFTDDVQAIAGFCKSDRQTLLFSATLKTKGIKHLTDYLMDEPQAIVLNSFEAKNDSIEQFIITADDLVHKEKLTQWLLTNEDYRKAIVFCNTKEQVDRLGGLIRYHKIAAGTLHGDISQSVRNHVMTQFRDSKIKVLIASDVAARGIDVKDIDLVINFDMAHNAEDYIHRIGRTARAGETGKAISLISHREWNLMVTIEKAISGSFQLKAIKELPANYKGPKKLKASGKAAGSKKKKDGTKKLTAREKKRLEKKHSKKSGASSGSSTSSSQKPKKKFGATMVDSGDTPMKKKS